MDELEGLRIDRVRGAYRLKFGHDIELEYRQVARGLRRSPRVILLLIIACGFGFAPLYGPSLFGSSAGLQKLLNLIEVAVVVPTALCAAAATYFAPPNALTKGLQTVAVICAWSGGLLLRHFALLGQMHYPSSMVGVLIISVTIFSGFSWYRIAPGAAVFFLVASIQEFQLQAHPADAWLESYGYLFMALIAILGSYVNELAYRISWSNGRRAQALARTDALTGLSNRAEFNRVFPKIIAQARREQRIVAIALLDLDHFKQINDSFGHLFGDEVLKAVSRSLLEAVARRPLDMLVRFGGEEMVVVWYGVTRETLPALVETLVASIRSTRLRKPNSEELLAITASIGVSFLIPTATPTPEQVLRHADTLMYRAKAAGRDRVNLSEYSTLPEQSDTQNHCEA